MIVSQSLFIFSVFFCPTKNKIIFLFNATTLQAVFESNAQVGFILMIVQEIAKDRERERKERRERRKERERKRGCVQDGDNEGKKTVKGRGSSEED